MKIFHLLELDMLLEDSERKPKYDTLRKNLEMRKLELILEPYDMHFDVRVDPGHNRIAAFSYDTDLARLANSLCHIIETEVKRMLGAVCVHCNDKGHAPGNVLCSRRKGESLLCYQANAGKTVRELLPHCIGIETTMVTAKNFNEQFAKAADHDSSSRCMGTGQIANYGVRYDVYNKRYYRYDDEGKITVVDEATVNLSDYANLGNLLFWLGCPPEVLELGQILHKHVFNTAKRMARG